MKCWEKCSRADSTTTSPLIMPGAWILQAPAHVFVREEKPRDNTVFRARRKCFPYTHSRSRTHAVSLWVFCGLRECEMWNPEWIERESPLTGPERFSTSECVFSQIETRRDLSGDSIQPVIDVVSLPRVTVVQSVRTPNVYPELAALPETLVLETTTLSWLFIFRPFT